MKCFLCTHEDTSFDLRIHTKSQASQDVEGESLFLKTSCTSDTGHRWPWPGTEWNTSSLRTSFHDGRRYHARSEREMQPTVLLSYVGYERDNDEHGMITLKVRCNQHSIIVRKTSSTGGKSWLLLET